jgi:hypothetical protein
VPGRTSCRSCAAVATFTTPSASSTRLRVRAVDPNRHRSVPVVTLALPTVPAPHHPTRGLTVRAATAAAGDPGLGRAPGAPPSSPARPLHHPPLTHKTRNSRSKGVVEAPTTGECVG